MNINYLSYWIYQMVSVNTSKSCYISGLPSPRYSLVCFLHYLQKGTFAQAHISVRARGNGRRGYQGTVFLVASHRSDLIGVGSVLQQHGDNISVALLSRLVQRGVAHLQRRRDGQTKQ